MGHLRLGELPRTRKWQQVVGLIEDGADAAEVATATMDAAERGLTLAANDPGLVETIWLLTQLPIAARSDDFVENLRGAGLDVSAEPTLMEVVSAFTDAVYARAERQGGRTDLGEMAQLAASETIMRIAGERAANLFGTTPGDVRDTFARLGTKAQFSTFARDFFARLTERCLGYFLSRAYSYHVGEGRRFTTLAQQGDFEGALRLHCQEASKIVEAFAGGWFSKTNWKKGGISRQDAAGFAWKSMEKVRDELKAGARPNAE